MFMKNRDQVQDKDEGDGNADEDLESSNENEDQAIGQPSDDETILDRSTSRVFSPLLTLNIVFISKFCLLLQCPQSGVLISCCLKLEI